MITCLDLGDLHRRGWGRTPMGITLVIIAILMQNSINRSQRTLPLTTKLYDDALVRVHPHVQLRHRTSILNSYVASLRPYVPEPVRMWGVALRPAHSDRACAIRRNMPQLLLGAHNELDEGQLFICYLLEQDMSQPTSRMVCGHRYPIAPELEWSLPLSDGWPQKQTARRLIWVEFSDRLREILELVNQLVTRSPCLLDPGNAEARR
mmetsp:Transcript_54044/g.94285  ORF Transcript_54044/g.94285 Transcript_54044/m.94285 type:complete len:207 (+) Transcript_54044:517-1137(+)